MFEFWELLVNIIMSTNAETVLFISGIFIIFWKNYVKLKVKRVPDVQACFGEVWGQKNYVKSIVNEKNYGLKVQFFSGGSAWFARSVVEKIMWNWLW